MDRQPAEPASIWALCNVMLLAILQVDVKHHIWHDGSYSKSTHSQLV